MRKLLLVLFVLMLPALAHAETYLNLDKIALDSSFQQRVQYAITATAQAVYSEAVVSPPSSYLTRHIFAIRVLGGGYNLQAIVLAVMANPAVAAEASFIAGGTFGIPDADISSALSAAFNGLAGY